MALEVTESEAMHPPRRRVISGDLDGFKVRATASAHYDLDAGEYAPFRLDGAVSIQRDGRFLLQARPSDIPEILDVVARLRAKAEA